MEFQRGQDEVPITIPILDDNTVEDIESFTVVLSVADADPNVELGPDNTTRITIIDDDSKNTIPYIIPCSECCSV